MSKIEEMKAADLGLSYEQAVHGVQSAIRQRIVEVHGDIGPEADKSFVGPKHTRVGIDMSKADQMALASLLIDRGIITEAEYLEALRLAANVELVLHEQQYRERHPGPEGLKVSFR